jgi:hypothetical protein
VEDVAVVSQTLVSADLFSGTRNIEPGPSGQLERIVQAFGVFIDTFVICAGNVAKLFHLPSTVAAIGVTICAACQSRTPTRNCIALRNHLGSPT